MCELDANVFNEKLNEISTIPSVSRFIYANDGLSFIVMFQRKLK